MARCWHKPSKTIGLTARLSNIASPIPSCRAAASSWRRRWIISQLSPKAASRWISALPPAASPKCCWRAAPTSLRRRCRPWPDASACVRRDQRVVVRDGVNARDLDRACAPAAPGHHRRCQLHRPNWCCRRRWRMAASWGVAGSAGQAAIRGGTRLGIGKGGIVRDAEAAGGGLARHRPDSIGGQKGWCGSGHDGKPDSGRRRQ